MVKMRKSVSDMIVNFCHFLAVFCSLPSKFKTFNEKKIDRDFILIIFFVSGVLENLA